MILFIVATAVFVAAIVLFGVEQHIAAVPPEARTVRERRFLAADRVFNRGLQFALRWIIPIAGVIVGVVFVVRAVTVTNVRSEESGWWLGIGVFILLAAIALFAVSQQRHVQGEEREFDPLRSVRRPGWMLVASAFIITSGVTGVVARDASTNLLLSSSLFIALGLSFAVAAVLQLLRNRQGARQQEQA